MKIYVINLASRLDRKQHTDKILKNFNLTYFFGVDTKFVDVTQDYNFDVFRQWRDPLLKRNITPGELGTSASHFMVWKLIADSNEPAVILEDDNDLIGQLDLDDIKSKLEQYDMIYLDYKEMHEDKVEDLGNNLVKPYYPYWTNAYAISNNFAKHLISLEFKNNLIPVDELFPILNNVDYEKHCLSSDAAIIENFKYLKSKFYTKQINIVSYKDKVFKQCDRAVFGTDVEVSEPNKYYAFTVGTDANKIVQLQESANNFDIKLINLGEGRVWRGGDMSSGPGGGQKLNLLSDYIKNRFIKDDDIILFVDGYDVIFNDDLGTIVERFKSFNVDVLFAAEKICWPDTSLQDRFTAHTDYKYLNSGCFIGYKWAIRRILNEEISDSDDDQLYLQKKYLSENNPYYVKLALDNENYVFQCVSAAAEDIDVLPNNQLFNKATETCPCILHGNGGEADKKHFFNLVDLLNSKNKIIPNTSFLNVVGPDILHGNFFTSEQCKKIISLAEKNGQWQALKYDTFPAQEIRVKSFSEELFRSIDEHFKNTINSAIENYWRPLLMYGLRDAFIIKYSPETQSSLNCHHDASLVSGIIRLNDNYEGGDTYFYRQNYSNSNVPVGDIILWPGQVTHGHEGRPVTSGIKYNLVIWTSRYEGDVNF